MDAEEARTIGKRVRYIRRARRKSLRVIAGLSGMSTATLHRIETGKRALDRRAEIAALANALQVAPSDLMPDVPDALIGINGDETYAAIQPVRLALRAAIDNVPGGNVLPVEVLRGRVTAAVDTLVRCEREWYVGEVLPGLIRDLHTTIEAGRDVAILLELSVLLHTQVTIPWMRLVGAPLDLAAHPLHLARDAARERGTPAPLGLAAGAGARVLLAEGALDLARAGLDAVTIQMNSPELMQLSGFLALFQSLVATEDKRVADAEAALDLAEDLATQIGEGNAYGLGFGRTNVKLWRMAGALKSEQYDKAMMIARDIRPEHIPNRCRQSAYWIDYGRAAARLPGHHAQAVMAFRTVEKISPYRVQRNPVVRDVLAELLHRRSYRDTVGRELRGMAYRAGLPGV